MIAKHNLRYFSGRICSILKEKGTSSYNEIADTLVSDYFESISEILSEEKQAQTEANIRRRAYDAINVLMAMNIIMKDNREIHWIGLPASSLTECRRLEEERVQTVDRLNQKSEQIKELIIQLVAYKRLIEQNREREMLPGNPLEANTLKIPYMVLDTTKQAVVDVTSSEDNCEMAHIKWAKMMAKMKEEPNKFVAELLLGKVVECSKIGLKQVPCVQVRVQQNEFYQHTKKYYPKLTDFWALDGEVNSHLGDTVLIRRAKEEDKPNERVQHQVDRIVFKHGVLIDPVTKKRVIQHDFVEDLELRQRLLEDIVVEPRKSIEEPSFEKQKEIQQERLKKHKGVQ